MITVEILDDREDGGPLLRPSAVRINGTDVGELAADGVKVDITPTNEGGMVYVTLVLRPDQVLIRQESESPYP